MARNGDDVSGQLPLSNSPVKWLFNLSGLAEEGRAGQIDASEEELHLLSEKLCEELNMEGGALALQLSHLTCSFHIRPIEMRQAYDAEGRLISGKNIDAYRGEFRFSVRYQTNCVVSLEPFEEKILDEFHQDFIKAGTYHLRALEDEEHQSDLLDEEPPIVFSKGRIELGPFLYQVLSLAIDPNPRKAGISLDAAVPAKAKHQEDEDKPPSPFLVLKDFKPKK